MGNFSTLVLSTFIVVQMTLQRLQIKIRGSLSRPISLKLLAVSILLAFKSFKRQEFVDLFKGMIPVSNLLHLYSPLERYRPILRTILSLLLSRCIGLSLKVKEQARPDASTAHIYQCRSIFK